MATVDEIVALGVGGEIASGLRAGARYITVDAQDMARALADAYQRGLRKGEGLERTRCIEIATHATIQPYSFQIHPEIPFEKFSEAAKVAAHGCAQGIAMEIRGT